jgi:hypothetical protein
MIFGLFSRLREWTLSLQSAPLERFLLDAPIAVIARLDRAI